MAKSEKILCVCVCVFVFMPLWVVEGLFVFPQLTGVVVRAAKRLQVNVLVEKIDAFR